MWCQEVATESSVIWHLKKSRAGQARAVNRLMSAAAASMHPRDEHVNAAPFQLNDDSISHENVFLYPAQGPRTTCLGPTVHIMIKMSAFFFPRIMRPILFHLAKWLHHSMYGKAAIVRIAQLTFICHSLALWIEKWFASKQLSWSKLHGYNPDNSLLKRRRSVLRCWWRWNSADSLSWFWFRWIIVNCRAWDRIVSLCPRGALLYRPFSHPSSGVERSAFCPRKESEVYSLDWNVLSDYKLLLLFWRKVWLSLYCTRSQIKKANHNM